MLVEVREAMFVCAWAKEVKRSLIGNVRVACDVGWGSRGNVCLCVSKRGEEKCSEECSCGMWCWLRFARQCLFVREQARWREVSWWMFVWHVMLVEVREAMFVCAWAKEVKRSVLRNVRVACDVGWGSRGNVCLCVSQRGEEKFDRECSCGMWCWLRFARQCLFVREQKRWREVSWWMFVWHVMLVEVREAMFVCAWAKEVKRSFIGNVRVACDVGWGSRGNVCLCVSKRGEEKFYRECSCGMWCWLRFARQCLFVREQKRWREVL